MEFPKIISKEHIYIHLCDHVALIHELPGMLAAEHVHWGLAIAAELGGPFHPRCSVETQEMLKTLHNIHSHSGTCSHAALQQHPCPP